MVVATEEDFVNLKDNRKSHARLKLEPDVSDCLGNNTRTLLAGVKLMKKKYNTNLFDVKLGQQI